MVRPVKVTKRFSNVKDRQQQRDVSTWHPCAVPPGAVNCHPVINAAMTGCVEQEDDEEEGGEVVSAKQKYSCNGV